MPGFDDPAFYGDRWAGVYDEHHAERDPAPAVDFLAGLARGGRVLELAIGTGRIALPLAARGITVEGVDASQAMVDRLRSKPGGQRIRVTIGDMAEVPVSGPDRAAPAPLPRNTRRATSGGPAQIAVVSRAGSCRPAGRGRGAWPAPVVGVPSRP